MRQLSALDWTIVIGFLGIILTVGILQTRRASKGLESFFLGGRNLPWWLAGLSMVATTFAADTPLAVTEIVGNQGIAGNWIWWSFLAGGMLTTFFFARLWRRANVLTEVELIELRYSGKPARFLRGFKSIYLGVFMNVMIMAWVNVALITLLEVFLGVTTSQAWMITGGIMVLTAGFSALAGFMGVAVTDAIQFVVAMISCVLLAYFVISSPDIGGITGLKNELNAVDENILNFMPSFGENAGVGTTLGLSISAFLAYAGIQWWASWYPGAEPGGGGYIAQRFMSTKNEKDAIKSTLLFQIAHYGIRPWPWILIGLCAIVLYQLPQKITDQDLQAQVMEWDQKIDRKVFTYDADKLQKWVEDNPQYKDDLPELAAINGRLQQASETDDQLKKSLRYSGDLRFGYVFAMQDYLPHGLLGLLLVAFLAAYISTISTHLNWGASYLINDLYKRFMQTDKSEKHYMLASRLVTVLLMIMGLVVSLFVESISGMWGFMMQCGAGLGLVLILRWYWWRINAWSEISATIAPFIITIPLYMFEVPFAEAFPLTVLFTTLVWLLVTIATKPTDQQTLKTFYDRVKPQGEWSPVAEIPAEQKTSMQTLWIAWLSGISCVYCILFAIGKWILFEWTAASILTLVAIISAWILNKMLARF